MDIYEADAGYRQALANLPRTQVEAYDKLVSLGRLPLDGTDVTVAILLRMAAYYSGHGSLTQFIQKRKVAPAADFLVEAVVLYLKVLSETHILKLDIKSEAPLSKRRGALRPDISIWKDGELLAAIECKTQLGWNRHRWESDHEARRKEVQADFPGVPLFLVVMTSQNWDGFDGHPQRGQEFFDLCSIWPKSEDNLALANAIGTPIEGLFRQVVSLARRDRP